MPTYGFTLICELHGPSELVALARQAEAAGFDELVISDHYHPWLESHGHSPFAWSVLGAVAAQTSTIELATMVTCPFMRYHPAVIAQAAATIAVMSDGRFTLGLGAGERLNEHVTGLGWPSVRVRHEMLDESVQAIRALWSGDWVDFEGDYVIVDDARVFDVPEIEPDIFIGVSGSSSVALAAELDVGICMVEPKGKLVDGYVELGGTRERTWGQLALSWDSDAERARQRAHDRFRFGLPGWKVMAELPNVVNFEAATALYTVDQVTEKVPSGADAGAVVEAIGQFVDAGVEHIAVIQIADEAEAFFDAWTNQIRPNLP